MSSKAETLRSGEPGENLVGRPWQRLGRDGAARLGLLLSSKAAQQRAHSKTQGVRLRLGGIGRFGCGFGLRIASNAWGRQRIGDDRPAESRDY